MKHIGKAIKEVYDRQPRSCTAAWFARQINCHRANVYDIFSRPTIDCELLERISIALNHNFFLDLAAGIGSEAGYPCMPDIPDVTPPPEGLTEIGKTQNV